jgi:hypothetical protein
MAGVSRFAYLLTCQRAQKGSAASDVSRRGARSIKVTIIPISWLFGNEVLGYCIPIFLTPVAVSGLKCSGRVEGTRDRKGLEESKDVSCASSATSLLHSLTVAAPLRAARLDTPDAQPARILVKSRPADSGRPPSAAKSARRPCPCRGGSGETCTIQVEPVPSPAISFCSRKCDHRRDAETQGRRDAETQGRRDAETQRRRDAETQRTRSKTGNVTAFSGSLV